MKYVRLSSIGIKTALKPVKTEKTTHKSDECFLVYPPKHSHIGAPVMEPKKGPKSATNEYMVVFANLPSVPKCLKHLKNSLLSNNVYPWMKTL